VPGLSHILTPGLAAALGEISVPRLVSPKIADDLLNEWAGAGAEIVELGASREGRAIRAAVIGPAEPKHSLLAWGYPHPDEPLGATAICWLAEQALRGRLQDLDGWRFVIIPCADPDQAHRQLWLEGRADAHAFAAGCWSPTHLQLEVDYGFPLDWGPFLQTPDWRGQCRLPSECRASCGESCRWEGLPAGPLPESLALARAIERFEPKIVASLHNTHAGGDYTFLLQRERREVMRDLLAIPSASGRARHLGEPIDRGVRWLRDAPDLIHERTLEYHRRQLERSPGYDPNQRYAVNHSAASFIEARPGRVQFICPESTLFYHPAFADTSPWGRRVRVREQVRRGRGGRFYRCRWVRDGGEWLLYEQERMPGRRRGTGQRELETEVTRGMLGCLALARRRRTLDAADRIWERVAPHADAYHPYMDERELFRAPGRFVGDRAMLIFRTRPDYRRPATVAQRATFAWEWPLHTATLLGNFANFLAAQDAERPQIAAAQRKLDRLIAAEIKQLPPRMREQAPWESAARSILARVLRLALDRG